MKNLVSDKGTKGQEQVPFTGGKPAGQEQVPFTGGKPAGQEQVPYQS
jgi:hypothetical protein